MIFKELQHFKGKKIHPILRSTEKYMSFIIDNDLVFLDSNQFLKESLDNLTKKIEDDEFIYTKREFPHQSTK